MPKVNSLTFLFFQQFFSTNRRRYNFIWVYSDEKSSLVAIYNSLEIDGHEKELETTKSTAKMSDGDSGVSVATGDSKPNDCHQGTPFIHHQDKDEEMSPGEYI